MKKKTKSIILIIFILFIIISFILYFKSNVNNNTKYNTIELEEINKLTKSEIKTIYNYKYNNNLIYMITSKNYDPNKLDLYLKYTEKYNEINYLKIFNTINNKNFIEKNIDKYIDLLKKYDNINGIINYINNNLNKEFELNETILNFMEEKYFIKDNLNRYIEYYNNNKNLEYSEIITRINSNLDKTFYVDVNPANTNKGIYTLVNKFFYLDKNYVSEDIVNIDPKYTSNAKLNKTALSNFIEMANAASKENLYLKITTGYRDYGFQKILYNNYVATDGISQADTYSARPGYSEHQLGYSVDLTNSNNVSFSEFEYTDEYTWLQKNAYKYGFILRYPKNKEYITGYQYEAWHYRYVGINVATYIYNNNITYEEYYEYFINQS